MSWVFGANSSHCDAHTDTDAISDTDPDRSADSDQRAAERYCHVRSNNAPNRIAHAHDHAGIERYSQPDPYALIATR